MNLAVPSRVALNRLLINKVPVLQIRSSHAEYEPRRFARWQDVPDDWVKTESKRDPDNLIYKTEQWKINKKKQIFSQQNDGVPVYLKRGLKDQIIYYTILASLAIIGFMTFKDIYNYQIFPKKKQ